MNEARKDFLDLLNKCQIVNSPQYPNVNFYIWNKDIDRVNKLGKILGKDSFRNGDSINFDSEYDIFFEEDLEHDTFWFNYSNSWIRLGIVNKETIIEWLLGTGISCAFIDYVNVHSDHNGNDVDGADSWYIKKK